MGQVSYPNPDPKPNPNLILTPALPLTPVDHMKQGHVANNDGSDGFYCCCQWDGEPPG